MNSIDSLIPATQPAPAEDDTQTMTRADWLAKNNHPATPGHTTRTERAEIRTEQAEARTVQANVRTEQAELRTEQANARTEQAEARTEKAEARSKAVIRASRDKPTETTAVQTGKKRILAVDDRASNTRLVKLFLEQTNDYLVREENNAKAALAAAEEFQPHLILLDVMMPDMDGGELAARFKENPKLKDVPIVFLTAAVTKGELEGSGGQVGGYPFLAKPVVLTEVAACLKRHLGG